LSNSPAATRVSRTPTIKLKAQYILLLFGQGNALPPADAIALTPNY
jgi:hypothetical protein